MKVRQCSSCGGFCKKSGCERANVYADRAAQQERKPAADDEIQRLKSDVAQMRETLDGIYNANPRNWEELSCEFTEFERWAKSRARHSLIKLEASESRVVEAPALKETP